jgi:GDP/UDP-N,N'-diacetylbacillosamine 2-epimerase (hydrolysing)
MSKICVVTGSRAEYGLLKWVINGIKESSKLNLQLIVTGMHLSPDFGNTYLEIEEDGFIIDEKIEILLSSDTPVGISKSMGLAVISFAEVLNRLKPDLVVVLGDRFEIFAAVVSTMVSKIPVAHISGGESSEGQIDESIRHSITKMSHLHFVANNIYKDRVIQLGEEPERVFLVGGLGVDTISRTPLMDKNNLEKKINFKFGVKTLLVTFHPVTLESGTSEVQIKELLSALNVLNDISIIFTMPNSDTDSRILFQLINEYVAENANSKVYTSLGQVNYLSCLKYVDGVLGNSSSGIAEVPSFKKGTVNIGDRQRGRIKASSVIDCEPRKNSILEAINTLYSKSFQQKLKKVINPYGEAGASDEIIRIIKSTSLGNILKKKFYNIPFCK